MDALPVTVVIPTIGRPELLRACLESLACCNPRAAEIVVVDQSDDASTTAIATAFAHVGARRVACRGIGIGAGMNHGLRAATHPRVLITHDDITVAENWVAVGAQKLAEAPRALHTGRVMPVGDPRGVPTYITDEVPVVHTSPGATGTVYPCNMACDRDLVLEDGGFDVAIRPAAEDNELSYRWLRAGRAIHFQPEMVVWHHDWRSPVALRELYVAYARGDGVFWTKHLLRGDLAVLRFALRDLWPALRTTLGAIRHRPAYPGYGLGAMLRGVPRGVVDGVRIYGPFGRDAGRAGRAC